MPDFAFASCLPGVEPAVKLEVARDRPDLAFAFSRPGLVTFKSRGAITPEDPPASVFARVWGRSLGTVVNADAVREQLADLGVTRVHVYSRDPDKPADLAPWAALAPRGPALVGELVANIIVPPGGSTAEVSFLGIHRHDPTRGPEAGGGFGVVVPEDAPSRAYAAKDSGIALKLAKEQKLNLPCAVATKKQYDRMVAAGLGGLDKSGVAELTFRGRRPA